MFLRQLKLHRDQLQHRLNRGGGQNVEQELAQTRQFLTATKDPKWRTQLIKRIKLLEQGQKSGEDHADLNRRFKMVDDLYQVVQHHPDYNKTRKRRTRKEE